MNAQYLVNVDIHIGMLTIPYGFYQHLKISRYISCTFGEGIPSQQSPIVSLNLEHSPVLPGFLCVQHPYIHVSIQQFERHPSIHLFLFLPRELLNASLHFSRSSGQCRAHSPFCVLLPFLYLDLFPSSSDPGSCCCCC